MKLFTRRRVLWGLGIGLPVLAFMPIAALWLNLFHAHEHCIKGTGLSLRCYALDHDGKFPFHTNGFGDAIVLLLKELGEPPREFTAPGDDGRLYRECMKTGAHIPEERCTRAYVQGP